jgi:hypothetical protein
MKFETSRVLYTAAAVLALIGVVLRAVPSPVSTESVPQIIVADLAPSAAVAESGADPTAFLAVVNANIFSQDRQPPAERYIPPELREEVEPTAAPASSGPRLPRLFGVVVGPADTVALIDADPSIPGAEVYRPGELVGDSRLVSVSDTAVVLEGPAGRRVLTLPSSSRRTP